MAAPVFESAASASESGFGANTVVVTKPSGVVSGDLLVAHVSVTNGTSLTLPSGWTLLDSVSHSGCYDSFAWKAATGSEPASYTFSYTTSSGERAAGGVGRISGADTTTPIDVSGYNTYTGDSAADESPSVTTTVADCLLVLTHGQDTAPSTHVAPSGTTERWAQSSPVGYSQCASVAAGGAGGTGAKVWDIGGFAGDFVLRTVAVKPSGGSPPPPPGTSSNLLLLGVG